MQLSRTCWALQWHGQGLPSNVTSGQLSSELRNSVLSSKPHRESVTIIARNSYSDNSKDDSAHLDHIKPLSPDQLPPSSQHHILLLATPHFAPALYQDESQWLVAFLDRLYSKIVSEGPTKVTVGIAVVDALPQPTRESEIHSIGATTSQNRKLSGVTLSDPGSAGYAYLFCDSSLLSYQAGAPKRAIAGNQPSAFVSLSLPSLSGRTVENRQYIVKIPLANTIFVTGRDVVSIIVELEKQGNGQTFQVVNTFEASAISARWPLRDARDTQGCQVALTAPLVPLTAPRKVKSAFGNIVREITGPEGEGSTIPASSELEAAVASFFEAVNEPQSTISAWAIVGGNSPAVAQSANGNDNHQPADYSKGLRKLWTSPRNVMSILPRLERGARLHRILSGGGGWGKRAGLLSLDPDTSPIAEDAAAASKTPVVEDVLPSQESMLGDIAKVGDSIQFFVLRTNAEPSERTNLPGSLRVWSFGVGAIPSTIDQMPITAMTSNSHTGPKDNLPFRYVADHFGALSESGFYLQIIDNSTSNREQSSITSKIDVPFSHLSVIQAKPRKSAYHSAHGSINVKKGWKVPKLKIRKIPCESASDPSYIKADTAKADTVHHETTMQFGPRVRKVENRHPRLRMVPTRGSEDRPTSPKIVRYKSWGPLVRRVEVAPSQVKSDLGDPFAAGPEDDAAWNDLTRRSRKAIAFARSRQRHREVMKANARLLNDDMAQQVERLLEGFVP